MKKPSAWQVAVKTEMFKKQISYEELANAVGTKAGYIRQLMCLTYSWVSDESPVKKKITDYLELEL